MYSSESALTLSSLLLSLSECEKQVETSRQDLCCHPHFDVYSLFTTIQDKTNGKISWTDLRLFLSRRSQAISREFLELLIAQYDSNFDQLLSLEEFKRFVLSRENTDLTLQTEYRKMLPSLYIESLMARHIELECNWQARLQVLKRKLFVSQEFTPVELFRMISPGEHCQADLESIRVFLKRFDVNVQDEDCSRVVRRIDTNNDLLISYQDFVDFVMPVNKKSRSPLRPPKTAGSTTRFLPSQRKNTLSSRQSIRPVLTPSPEKSKTTQAAPQLPPDTATATSNPELIKVFSQQLELDKALEKSRLKLTNHLDFSFDELVKLLDRQSRGFVSGSDFESILRDLHVPYHKDEVSLVIRHFSKEGKISHRQCKDLVLPITWKDRKRVATFKDEGYRVFLADTLNDLVEFLKALLKTQVSLERVRNCITSDLKTQLFQVFHDMDLEKCGKVGLDSFRSYLAGGGLNLREGEVRLLFKRYSKSSHKEINFNEFIDELTPRTAV